LRKLLIVLSAVATITLISAVWITMQTLRGLEESLQSEQRQSATLRRQLSEGSRALEQSRREAEALREQAESALLHAEESSAAAEVAAKEREQAEEAQMRAQQAKEAASLREQQARQELADLRDRRQKELDRMQQALSQIAPTRRTASGMVIELANDSFYFDFDKATLSPENREILSRIAGVLLASDGYRLFVYGHTDDIGPADYNQDLSVRRASSVADYLRQAGVPDEVLNVQGFGKSSPRVRNDSSEARQKNRRVEIGIVDSIIDYKGLAPSA
jgi:OOP family OmpA-OmpF porin